MQIDAILLDGITMTIAQNKPISPETDKDLSELLDLLYAIKSNMSAFCRLPEREAQRHEFASEIKRLSHQIENWAEMFEIRRDLNGNKEQGKPLQDKGSE